jgi:hypothetical protein
MVSFTRSFRINPARIFRKSLQLFFRNPHKPHEIDPAKGVAEHHVLIFTVECLPQIVGERFRNLAVAGLLAGVMNENETKAWG